MTRIKDVEQARRAAIVEWVDRQCVDCLNCGGRIFLQPASNKWRHVRGERMGPTRCRPGSFDEARPNVEQAGQVVMDLQS